MTELSWAAIVRFVHERANNCCEYCYTCRKIIGQTMHVDHILPDGGDSLENLCLACPTCNMAKSNVVGDFDPDAESFVYFFNPRTQKWSEHFRWVDGGRQIEGITPIGRLTVERFSMNLDRLIIARTLWIKAEYHPPSTT